MMLELTDISSNSLSITAQAPLSRHPTCRAPPHATLPDRHETMKLHTRTQHHAQRCSQPAAARRLQVQCSSSSTNTSKPAPPSHDTQPRRDVLLQFASALCVPAAASLVSPAPAAAENGLTTWWKSRRTVNGGQKLLAPLYVAQRRLQEAKAILQQTSSPGPDDLTAALQLVRSSSLNCYIFEALPTDNLDTKASLLTQKLELSDPCTWRIVLKNTVDFEPVDVQAAAEQKLDALVLSFQHLDSLLDMAREGNPDAVPKAQDQIDATMLIAADIESFVKQTLGV